VKTIAQRQTDWYRTGLVGGGAVVAIVAAGVSAVSKKDNAGPNSYDPGVGGGKPGSGTGD